MTRVRMDLFTSLDGYTPADQTAEDPMGADWGRLTEAYAATRTFRKNVFGDTSGEGTTGLDERYAAAFADGVGAEIMGGSSRGCPSARTVDVDPGAAAAGRAAGPGRASGRDP